MEKSLRNKTLYTRVTDEEKELVLKRMETAGITNISEYVRKMVLHGYIIEVDMEPLGKIYYELARIGCNVNQLAKIANQTGSIHGVDVQALSKEVRGIAEQLEGFLDCMEEEH